MEKNTVSCIYRRKKTINLFCENKNFDFEDLQKLYTEIILRLTEHLGTAETFIIAAGDATNIIRDNRKSEKDNGMLLLKNQGIPHLEDIKKHYHSIF